MFDPYSRDPVRGYAAQANPKIDDAKAEKNPFRMETNYSTEAPVCHNCSTFELRSAALPQVKVEANFIHLRDDTYTF